MSPEWEKPIRFGFYTSRTEIEPKAAKQALKQELEASDRQELLQLLPGGKQEFGKSRPKF
jgi:hypothetical protein